MIEAEDIIGVRLCKLLPGAKEFFGKEISYTGVVQIRGFNMNYVSVQTPQGLFAVGNSSIEPLPINQFWMDVFGFETSVNIDGNLLWRKKDIELLIHIETIYVGVGGGQKIAVGSKWGVNNLQDLYYNLYREALLPIKNFM